tara:strand:- start:7 stop:1512 length:1506 start_codon:yes stop_codon:yes gene_type:complete
MSDSNASGCTSMPVVILALLFFWPVGLVLMWTGKTFNLVIRVLITLFFMAAIFLSFTFGLLAMAPGCEGLTVETSGPIADPMGEMQDRMKEAKDRMKTMRDKMKEARKDMRDEFAKARKEMKGEQQRIQDMIEAFKKPKKESDKPATKKPAKEGKLWFQRRVKPSAYEHVKVEAQEIKPLRPVEFETGSDVIREGSYSLLDEVVTASSEYGVSKLLVGGHTDDVGSDSDNMRLSQRRADAVKRYLETKKIGAELLAIGFGETRPLVEGQDEEARAQNRRVEFQIIEKAATPKKRTLCSGEDDETACLEKRCEAGEARACLERGEQLYGKDETTRRLFNRKACDGGDLLACTKLGAQHERGAGGSKDLKEALLLYTQACAGQDGDGCNNLGSLHKDGEVVSQNYGEAKRLYEKACELGTGNGCSNLGVLYEDGQGVDKAPAKGLELHEKACGMDAPGGCLNAGRMHATGAGVPRNQEQAKVMFKKSCDLGLELGCKRYQLLR